MESQLNEFEKETRELSTLRESLECLDSFCESIKSNFDDADWTTRREILRTLIDKVVVESEQIRIVYRSTSPFLRRKLAKAEKRKFCTFVGGALSPLLANILLDDFDKELEKRGLGLCVMRTTFWYLPRLRKQPNASLNRWNAI